MSEPVSQALRFGRHLSFPPRHHHRPPSSPKNVSGLPYRPASTLLLLSTTDIRYKVRLSHRPNATGNPAHTIQSAYKSARSSCNLQRLPPESSSHLITHTSSLILQSACHCLNYRSSQTTVQTINVRHRYSKVLHRRRLGEHYDSISIGISLGSPSKWS